MTSPARAKDSSLFFSIFAALLLFLFSYLCLFVAAFLAHVGYEVVLLGWGVL